MRKLTTEEFKQKYFEKFGNKYNLNKFVYQNSKIPSVVTCPIHGDFMAKLNDLLKGQGCPICGGTHKYDTEEFIEKANFVHNNYFSYKKTIYMGSNNKVIVTCPIHGDFEVRANNHIKGNNCPFCAKEKIQHHITKLPQINSSTKKLTTNDFLEKYKEKFENNYNFDKFVYVNTRTKSIVTCPIHGDFKITPQKLMAGRGCNKCSKNYQYTTEEFIQLSNTIHNNFYHYQKTNYVSTHKNIIVTCPIHGDFEITPANHLHGHGCPICKQSKLEIELKKLLIENNINFEQQKRFEWLGKQTLDFYLPDHNIAIECQGIQHFKPIPFFGGKEHFSIQIQRDNVKKTLCKQNNINLLYFTNLKEYQNNQTILNSQEIVKKIKNI